MVTELASPPVSPASPAALQTTHTCLVVVAAVGRRRARRPSAHGVAADSPRRLVLRGVKRHLEGRAAGSFFWRARSGGLSRARPQTCAVNSLALPLARAFRLPSLYRQRWKYNHAIDRRPKTWAWRDQPAATTRARASIDTGRALLAQLCTARICSAHGRRTSRRILLPCRLLATTLPRARLGFDTLAPPHRCVAANRTASNGGRRAAGDGRGGEEAKVARGPRAGAGARQRHRQRERSRL